MKSDPPKPTIGQVVKLSAKLLGRRGGTARASKLSAERRQEIARKAALARWGKSGSE